MPCGGTKRLQPTTFFQLLPKAILCFAHLTSMLGLLFSCKQGKLTPMPTDGLGRSQRRNGRGNLAIEMLLRNGR